MAGRVLQSYTWQAVGGELDLLVLIGGAEERAEILDNFQHSTRVTPKSRSCTLNSSRENPRARIIFILLNTSFTFI
jgi:hypothetical protein